MKLYYTDKLFDHCFQILPVGLPENIEDNKTGWLVPKNNPKALAEKIIEVLNLPTSKIEEISNNAKTRVREYFTIEQQQQKFVEFYKE